MKPGTARGAGVVLGGAITACFAAIAVVAYFWTPYDPRTLAIVDKLQSPSLHH